MAKKLKERKQKERLPLEKVGHGPEGGGFARALGSTDFLTRERGIQALTLWLSSHKNVAENDMLRLWKALFYCFWHSDKAPVQVMIVCMDMYRSLIRLIPVIDVLIRHIYATFNCSECTCRTSERDYEPSAQKRRPTLLQGVHQNDAARMVWN